MISLHPFCSWIRYRKNAVTKHGVHSPFVFDFVTNVLPADKKDHRNFTAEQWRNECLHSEEIINVTDLGTGKSGPRKIAEIARRAAKSAQAGQLLFRIVKHYHPSVILELGTSLGISAHYLHAGNPDARLITIEGCPATAAAAKRGFDKYKITTEQFTGNFADRLQPVLETLKSVDLVYIDGNHRKNPTLEYFHVLKKYRHNDAVFIFDDIHWSAEMEDAWNEIKSDKDVTVSIDVFEFGLVFFRKEQPKQDFVLR